MNFLRSLCCLLLATVVVPVGSVAAESPGSVSPHAQRMAVLGYQRYRGSWRTAQEISLIEQAEAAKQGEVAARQRLERLREGFRPR